MHYRGRAIIKWAFDYYNTHKTTKASPLSVAPYQGLTQETLFGANGISEKLQYYKIDTITSQLIIALTLVLKDACHPQRQLELATAEAVHEAITQKLQTLQELTSRQIIAPKNGTSPHPLAPENTVGTTQHEADHKSASKKASRTPKMITGTKRKSRKQVIPSSPPKELIPHQRISIPNKTTFHLERKEQDSLFHTKAYKVMFVQLKHLSHPKKRLEKIEEMYNTLKMDILLAKFDTDREIQGILYKFEQSMTTGDTQEKLIWHLKFLAARIEILSKSPEKLIPYNTNNSSEE